MNPKKHILLAVLVGFAGYEPWSFAAKGEPTEIYQARTLDGVVLEAVETYLEPKSSEVGIGTGWYPLNPYFNGLGITADYTMHFSRTMAWEILNATYIYGFQKGLTAELAESWSVRPEAIEYLSYAFGSNFLFTHSSGKLIFLDDYVRYFRSSVIAGPGMIKTSERNLFASNLGLRFEVFSSSSFSWRFDIRDTISVPDFDHFVSFSLTTGFSF